MNKKFGIALALSLFCIASVYAVAASSRTSWVTTQIYNFNHPFAATDSAELSTKMSTMAQSPFNFYRGTDHIFFTDTSVAQASAYATTQTGYTWLGGDTHLGNFGADIDSDADVRFTVNDFDEGYLGQYVWDLRRLAVSFVLAGRENGISDADITTAIQTMVDNYVTKMNDFQGTSAELSYKLKSGDTSGAVLDVINKSKADTLGGLLTKYTQTSGTTRVFQNLSDLISVNSSTYNAINAAMTSYINSIPASKRQAASYYTVKDIHQKLNSGVGSLGKLRYYILIEGPSSSNADDRILEIKQTIASSVYVAAPNRLAPASYSNNEACRVAKTLRAQTLAADPMAGCAVINGTAFYFHERSPNKEGFDYTTLTTGGKLNTAAQYFGKALAAAHAIADQDYDSSIVSYSIDKQVSNAVTSKSGLKSEISTFAFDYAAQVQLDWQSFVSAYNAGTPLY